MATDVVVVGSLSVDFAMWVPRRPAKGETITGSDFQTFVGGKGNNQALAAARAGAQVTMIGCVGADAYGDHLAARLQQAGVNTDFLFRDKTIGTGIANIYVDPEGDNSIVIVPRANTKLTPEVLAGCKDTISGAKYVLLQLESPYETVAAAAKMAKSAGVKVILNPAPAPPDGKLPKGLIDDVDLLIPNQTEAQLMTGMAVNSIDDAMRAADRLQSIGSGDVIITLGEQGAFIMTANGTATHVPSFQVTPIDTTAAGDAFCGALAASLAQGLELPAAVRVACAAGALATTKPGAEPSLPLKQEIEQLLGNKVESAR